MAVRARYNGANLVYDGRVWTGDREVTVRFLNEVDPDAISSYMGEVVRARQALEATFGPDGWEIISADPEPPPEPGVVY